MLYIPLILFTLLAAADITSTMIGLSKGGVEAHPVMAWMFKKMSPLGAMLLMKVPVVALAWYAIPLAAVTHPWIVYGPLLPALVHLYCVVNNIKVLKDMKES